MYVYSNPLLAPRGLFRWRSSSSSGPGHQKQVLPVLRDAGGVHGVVQLPPLLQQRQPGEHADASHQRRAGEEPDRLRRQVQGDRGVFVEHASFLKERRVPALKAESRVAMVLV